MPSGCWPHSNVYAWRVNVLGIESSCDETAAAVVQDGRRELASVVAAQALAWARDLPIVGVNHLEGHVYANFLLEHEPRFPLVCLIVSGGHTDLIAMPDHLCYERLGRTRDDAAGEAFDKVA